MHDIFLVVAISKNFEWEGIKNLNYTCNKKYIQAIKFLKDFKVSFKMNVQKIEKGETFETARERHNAHQLYESRAFVQLASFCSGVLLI